MALNNGTLIAQLGVRTGALDRGAIQARKTVRGLSRELNIAFRSRRGTYPKLLNEERVIQNISNEIAAIKGRSAQGMLLYGDRVLGVAVPLTPIDTGFLRTGEPLPKNHPGAPPALGKHGPYRVVEQRPDGPVLEIGYTADYAPIVHEVDRNYKAPGTQWKYLQTAIQQTAGEAPRMVAAEVKVGCFPGKGFWSGNRVSSAMARFVRGFLR